MKIFSLIFVVAMYSFSGVAFAKCDKDDKTVFSCLTGKSKLIEVCDAGKRSAIPSDSQMQSQR